MIEFRNPEGRVRALLDLLAVPSVSGDWPAQRRVQQLLIDGLRSAAPELEVEQSAEGNAPWALVRASATGRPALLFVCHVDTVPVGDAGLWSVDPSHPDLVGTRVYGRGATDMLGGTVAAAAALLEAEELGIPCQLLLTSDEEIGCVGARSAVRALDPGQIGATIVPEPTDNVIVAGHRGVLWLRVETRGRAAHGSMPELGSNAILSLSRALAAAERALPLRENPVLGRETWNVGVVSGGDAPNIVPTRAEALIDMRTIDVDDSVLEEWWRAQPDVAEVETMLRLPPLALSNHHPWVRSLNGTLDDGPAPYFTDASIVAAATPGVPVVIWGPGKREQMHAPDEYLERADLEAGVVNLIGAVQSW